MSIETELKNLTAAVNALTAAVLARPAAPVTPVQAAATPTTTAAQPAAAAAVASTAQATPASAEPAKPKVEFQTLVDLCTNKLNTPGVRREQVFGVLKKYGAETLKRDAPTGLKPEFYDAVAAEVALVQPEASLT